MLRYFLLLLHGGIYTDLDTKLLKPIPTWGEDYDLYRQGRGWLYPSDREEGLTEGEVERWKRDLGGASLIVGVESDVGDREDWNDWWPRPVSFESVPRVNYIARCSSIETSFFETAPNRAMDIHLYPLSSHPPRRFTKHNAQNVVSLFLAPEPTCRISPSAQCRTQSGWSGRGDGMDRTGGLDGQRDSILEGQVWCGMDGTEGVE